MYFCALLEAGLSCSIELKWLYRGRWVDWQDHMRKTRCTIGLYLNRSYWLY